ncbi:alpha/beta fold hydrolase [Prosthecomicrobium sp. N25]|uniref:alpha/beta fold hydrolase n=1 Tax=Prosthecomicrobium sp. N25 TaxID=3129254 RepID=UPI003076983B
MSHRQAIVFEGAEGNRLVGDLYEPAAPGGPVALLLHGGGQTRHAWRGTERRLADHGYVAIAYDQRGHGDSDWPTSGRYAFDDYAQDLTAVADQVEARWHRRPIVIGASLGGIAGMLAEGEADRPILAGLVLVDVTPRMDPEGVAKVLGFMGDRIEDGFATIEEAADAIAAYLPNRTRPTSLEGLRKNLRHHPDGRWRWHWDPRFLKPPGPPQDTTARRIAAARNLRIPTLLVRGRQSELVSEEHVAEFMRLVPHAAFADVSGAGHMVAGDRNDVFAAAVLRFLEATFPVGGTAPEPAPAG